MDTVAGLLEGLDDSNSRIATVIDTVLQTLEREGLAWRVRIPPKHVGIHPQNRGGWGVTPAGVHALGSKIVAMGFLPSETSHAVCIEDACGESRDFSQALCDTSDGLLGCSRAEVKYGSVSCSHVNQFLVALTAGVRTDYEELAVDGKMSFAKLAEDKHLKYACEHGLNWLVVSAKAVERFKKLPGLIQAAKNATGAVHQAEDSFQILQQLQTMAASMAATGQLVDWGSIKRVISMRTQCSPSDLNALIGFAQKFGGGSTTNFVEDLGRFHKMYVPTNRVISASFWQALADLRVNVSELCPYFIYATIKCQAACPKDKCDGNVARFISVSEVNTLALARKEAMVKAEKVLSECRLLAKQSAASPEDCSRALGRLDLFIARIVFDKKVEMQTMEEVTRKFAEEIGCASGGVKPITAASASSHTPNVVQYDDEGRPVAGGALMLRTLGFDVGAAVKSGDGLFSITKVHDDGSVTVKDARTHNDSIVSHNDFLAKYKKTTETFEEFNKWAEHRPEKQQSYIDSVGRAYALAAIAMLAGRTPAQNLKVVVKPSKSVIAMEAFAKDKLVLFPETQKISFDNRTPGALMGTVSRRQVFFAPTPCTEAFAVPAWGMRSVEAECDANMHLANRKVQVKIGELHVEVVVPVFVNRRKVQVGEELVFFKAPVAKAAPSTTKRPLSFKPEAKAKAKAKTAPPE